MTPRRAVGWRIMNVVSQQRKGSQGTRKVKVESSISAGDSANLIR
jgi:hypothetical protein